MTGRLISVGCSWCHAIVMADDPAWPTCRECGHRADVARMFCDCHACRTGASVRIFPLDVADALARFEVDGRRVPRAVLDQLRAWGVEPGAFGLAAADEGAEP